MSGLIPRLNQHVPQREIRPPTPRSEATVCAVTTSDISELPATFSVALYSCLAVASNGRIHSAAERVSVNAP